MEFDDFDRQTGYAYERWSDFADHDDPDVYNALVIVSHPLWGIDHRDEWAWNEMLEIWYDEYRGLLGKGRRLKFEPRVRKLIASIIGDIQRRRPGVIRGRVTQRSRDLAVAAFMSEPGPMADANEAARDAFETDEEMNGTASRRRCTCKPTQKRRR